MADTIMTSMVQRHRTLLFYRSFVAVILISISVTDARGNAELSEGDLKRQLMSRPWPTEGWDEVSLDLCEALLKTYPSQANAKFLIDYGCEATCNNGKELFDVVADSPFANELSDYHRAVILLRNLHYGYLAGGEVLEESIQEWRDGSSDASSSLPELDRLMPLILDILRLELRLFPSNRSAWILGYFRDLHSLPLLKQYFLEANDYFYGSGSGTGDASPLTQEYIWLHVLEQSITQITGKSIASSINPSPTDIARLEVGNRGASLYVLERLSLRSAAFRSATRQHNWDINPGFYSGTVLLAGELGRVHTFISPEEASGFGGAAILETLSAMKSRYDIEKNLGPSIETRDDSAVYFLGCYQDCLKVKISYERAKIKSVEPIWFDRPEDY